MPIGFLTQAERERLKRFPEHIPDDDLNVFFLLSETDQQAVNRQQDDHTRLGFALQLCTLRYLGFVPHDLETAPSSAIEYVAEQLNVPPEAIQSYGSRIPTRTTHLQQVQLHLDFAGPLPLISTPCKPGCWKGPWNMTSPPYSSSWLVTNCVVSKSSVQVLPA